jgi:ABC-2 type transport system ATP-binding protein
MEKPFAPSMSKNGGMLEVRDLTRSFGATHALRGLNLTVRDGTAAGLLGPNGAGKTTLLRAIAGIVIPDAGSLRWNGAEIDRQTRRRFGYLPEERGLYSKMRVREQIAFFARLHGLDRRGGAAAADEWIERLQLGANAAKACGTLSKGNQQKVQIACAVAHGPELLILDEPFSGLDVENAEALLETLVQLRDARTTMLLCSHQLWQIERICAEFAIVSAGTIRAQGSLASLRAAWTTRTIRVSPPSAPIRAELHRLAPSGERVQADAVEVDVDRSTDLTGLASRLAAAGELRELHFVEPPLSEIYARAVAV